MKATNIEWDVNCPEDLEALPKEVVIGKYTGQMHSKFSIGFER